MTVVAPRRADLRLLHWAGLFEREGRLRVPSRFASRGQAAQSAVRRS